MNIADQVKLHTRKVYELLCKTRKSVSCCILIAFAIISLTSTLTFAEIKEDAITTRGRSFSKELFESGQLVDQADARADFSDAVKDYEGRGVAMNLPEAFSLFKSLPSWETCLPSTLSAICIKKEKGLKEVLLMVSAGSKQRQRADT